MEGIKMSSRVLWLLLIASSWILVGCQKNAISDLTESELLEPVTTASSAHLRPDSKPDEVVIAFLEAIRSGDESVASQLLTLKAQEETEKEGLSLDPPGTPSMQYRIEKVEYVADIKDAAYVNSVWTDSAAGPSENPFEVVWVLRRQSDGWRIAGMAAQIVPDEPPVFINFEEPNDVQRLKGQLDDEPSSGYRGSVRRQTSTNLPIRFLLVNIPSRDDMG
jgi:hypothetical protein